MNRLVLTIAAICLGPWLSGCCCCGGTTDCGSYGGCLPYEHSYGSGGGCNCQNDEFSLPPEGTSFPAQSGATNGTWSNGTWYGPETMGPEVVGPEFVPNGSEWQTVAPAVPGSNGPVTPANPGGNSSGPSALSAPSPIPAISNGSVVVPPPAPPYSPASNSSATGPMMPPVPPPPPEPISQMRFRQYR